MSSLLKRKHDGPEEEEDQSPQKQAKPTDVSSAVRETNQQYAIRWLGEMAPVMDTTNPNHVARYMDLKSRTFRFFQNIHMDDLLFIVTQSKTADKNGKFKYYPKIQNARRTDDWSIHVYSPFMFFQYPECGLTGNYLKKHGAKTLSEAKYKIDLSSRAWRPDHNNEFKQDTTSLECCKFIIDVQLWAMRQVYLHPKLAISTKYIAGKKVEEEVAKTNKIMIANKLPLQEVTDDMVFEEWMKMMTNSVPLCGKGEKQDRVWQPNTEFIQSTKPVLRYLTDPEKKERLNNMDSYQGPTPDFTEAYVAAQKPNEEEKVYPKIWEPLIFKNHKGKVIPQDVINRRPPQHGDVGFVHFEIPITTDTVKNTNRIKVVLVEVQTLKYAAVRSQQTDEMSFESMGEDHPIATTQHTASAPTLPQPSECSEPPCSPSYSDCEADGILHYEQEGA